MKIKKEFKVCLSCPGDLNRERQICESAIADFNKLYVTEDIQYSVFHFGKVPSEFGATAQEIINKNWEGFDLYIGLMGARFGSPTKEYGSGTEEEFKNAIERKKERQNCLCFFLISKYQYGNRELFKRSA